MSDEITHLIIYKNSQCIFNRNLKKGSIVNLTYELHKNYLDQEFISNVKCSVKFKNKKNHNSPISSMPKDRNV